MLRIVLFGPPTVFKSDQPLPIKRLTTRALLFYLAGMGKPVARDIVMDMFWPEAPFKQARRALTDTLSKLCKELADKTVITKTPAFLALNRQAVQVDWLDFQEALKEILRQLDKVGPAQALPASLDQKIRAALSLWQGRTLLENDEGVVSTALDNWVRGLRSECDAFLLRVLPRLAAHEALMGNHEQALHWLKQAQAVDEFDEQVNRALFEIYLSAQRYAEAREQYEKIKFIYQEGLGDTIPAGLHQLGERLSRLNPADDLLPQAEWNLRSGLTTPFIGQTEALEQLVAARKRGGGALVLGDAGSGKTRLVQEYHRREGQNLRLLVGSCQPLETNLPFAPWINLLRASIRADEWRQLSLNWAAPLAQILPDLFNFRPDLQPQPFGRSENSRTVVLEAVHQLFRLLAQKNELLLFLDDVHWADESSLALAAYLLKKMFVGPGTGFLILSTRTEAQNPLLDKFLLTSFPQPLRPVKTRLFTAEDLSELCYFAFSRLAPSPFVEKLFQDTGGNEFYATQILKAYLDEHPEPEFEEVTSLPLPPSMVEAMRQRLRGLSSEAREVVNLAAVLGSQFESQILEAVVGLPAETFPPLLAELEQAQILQPVREGSSRLAFVHEKMREGLLFHLNQGRKRFLHRKVALALESYLGPNPAGHAVLLAQHYEEAGLFSRAFEAWSHAAQHAWRMMSIAEAMSACGRAERLIFQAHELTDQQIYEMYRVWNQIAFDNDDFKTLEALNLALQTLGTDRDSALLIGAALTGLSDAEMARNQFDRALAYAEQAAAYVQKTDSLYEQARASERRGVYQYMLGHLREAQPNFRRALELTQNANDFFSLIERGSTFFQLAITETVRGYPLQGVEHAQQSLETHQRAGNALGSTAAYSVMGLANYLIGNYVGGRDTALRGLELAVRMDAWRMCGYLYSYAAMSELELGQLDEAWEHAQKAIAIGSRQGHGEITGLGYRVIGDVYLHLGALAKANEAYQQGQIAAGQHFVALENRYRLGYTQVLLGQEIGHHYLLQAIRLAEQADLGAISVLGTVLELSMYLFEGDRTTFETRAALFKQQVSERVRRDVAGFYLDRILAEHAFEQKDYQQAYDRAQASIHWYRQTQNSWYKLSCLWILDQASQQLGRGEASLRPEIEALLAQLERSLQRAPLKTEWQAFRARFST